MLFSKNAKLTVVLSAVFVAGLSTATFAQDTTEATAVDAAVKLSEKAVKQIKRYPDQALKDLLRFAFLHSEDGTVTNKSVDEQNLVEKAALRARYLEPVFRMDLDADGAVSADEFSLAIRFLEGRRQTESVLVRRDADTDRDGGLSLEEIMAYAVTKADVQSGNARGRGRVSDEIMRMDINGDGQTTIDEITAVVSAVTN